MTTKYDKFINSVLNEANLVKGGKADKYTVEEIAKKHKVSVDAINKQIEMGLKVESEHTKSHAKAREIVLDHLVERPDYYTKLDKMEKTPITKVKEMVSADAGVGSTAATGTGVAPQDAIPYAKGDARIPKVLGAKKRGGKTQKTPMFRRATIKM